MKLKIGTRASVLARTQTELVTKLISVIFPHVEVEHVLIKSEGDNSTAPLSEIGGRGVFTAYLSTALLEEKIDVAVHSLKDIPTAESEGLTLGAILQREDPRDVLIAKQDLNSLPESTVIGTGSLRRRAQLMALSPQLKFQEIRGNVHTRIKKVLSGTCEATLLAQAGLNRLEHLSAEPPSITMDDKVFVYPFSIETMTPAVAQGAIAIECRSDDKRVLEIVNTLDHRPSRNAVEVERAMLRRLGGGCQVPFAAHADTKGLLHLVIADENGYCQRLKGPMNEAKRLMDKLLVDGQRIVDKYLSL